jgi:hypothetical protein
MQSFPGLNIPSSSAGPSPWARASSCRASASTRPGHSRSPAHLSLVRLPPNYDAPPVRHQGRSDRRPTSTGEVPGNVHANRTRYASSRPIICGNGMRHLRRQPRGQCAKRPRYLWQGGSGARRRPVPGRESADRPGRPPMSSSARSATRAPPATTGSASARPPNGSARTGRSPPWRTTRSASRWSCCGAPRLSNTWNARRRWGSPGWAGARSAATTGRRSRSG